MKVYQGLAGMAAALCASATASAQSPATPDAFEPYANVLGARVYSCVDPSDSLARRRVQSEPCTWPMYHLPVPDVGEAPRWPTYLPRSTGAQADPVFWRFPVQPRGPYDAPRHGWR